MNRSGGCTRSGMAPATMAHDHASAVGNEGDYADADDKRHGDILRMEYNVPLEAANTQMHWYN